VPVEVDRAAADRGDERGEVLDLPLHRVRQGVTAVEPAAAVVGDGPEVPAERLGGRAHQRRWAWRRRTVIKGRPAPNCS
jgi:hypothetical protein